MTRLSELGERKAIERFADVFSAGQDVSVGIGDDCAIVSPAWSQDTDLVLTSDAVLESIHFEPDADATKVGHKALGRCLSDLAATGAVPAWGLINLVCRQDQDVERLEACCSGAEQLARRVGLSIIGGDTSRGDSLQLHVFCMGTVPRGTALLRSTARPGDSVYVTGSLGGSIHSKHLSFDPRIDEGLWLRQQGVASAAIDISDGLAIDAGRLAASSGCGMLLDGSKIPISATVAGDDPAQRLRHALADGEDYELLFCVSGNRSRDFEAAWRQRFELACTAIGTVQDSEHGTRCLELDGETVCPLDGAGYEHFRDHTIT
ncbi:MAG: thiamine-phosphate kinase [Verrucomicrobia bacterium]|nr:thiamine-phosphate kinase [Verrucomicrobiota bacterium]MDA1087440.1 thiamine-phosphate kinase [Verrucomicrobiota bacterium]